MQSRKGRVNVCSSGLNCFSLFSSEALEKEGHLYKVMPVDSQALCLASPCPAAVGPMEESGMVTPRVGCPHCLVTCRRDSCGLVHTSCLLVLLFPSQPGGRRCALQDNSRQAAAVVCRDGRELRSVS